MLSCYKCSWAFFKSFFSALHCIVVGDLFRPKMQCAHKYIALSITCLFSFEPTIHSDLCKRSLKLHVLKAKQTVFGCGNVVQTSDKLLTSDWIFCQFILIFSTIYTPATNLKGSIHFLSGNLIHINNLSHYYIEIYMNTTLVCIHIELLKAKHEIQWILDCLISLKKTLSENISKIQTVNFFYLKALGSAPRG